MEEQLLRACSAGLERARCVSASLLGSEKPRGIAMVSWSGAARVSIEVGLADADAPLWLSRDLDFADADPEAERWRAVGFTIALLADDPRFWGPEPEPEPVRVATPIDRAPTAATAVPGERSRGVVAELRGLTGAGIVGGPWRWGAELRLAVPLSEAFFVTGSLDYALASAPSLDVRWFDATLGLGLDAGSVYQDLDVRLRLELLGENVAASVQRDQLRDRASAWVPGVSLGGDLLWSFGEPWLLSARADVFWLDGSTAIVSAGQPLGASVGAGVLLGLGAGYRF